jgi:prepilin-type N-terminal cleavage/methylation domain-containing protein
MPHRDVTKRWSGFTLIEVLVTVVVIGVLAAVVIPAVASQVGSGDTTRVLADLNSIRTGIENFAITVRAFPGDMDDLANPITTGDGSGSPVVNFTSAHTDAWRGPYIEKTVSSTNTGFFDAFPTGLGASIENRLDFCDISSRAVVCKNTGANYVTILINHLTLSQDTVLNELIDGGGESNPETTGKFRFYIPYLAANSAYYYATPFK